MSGEWYVALNDRMRRTERRARWVYRCARYAPLVMAAAYLLLLAWELFERDGQFIRCLAVPAGVFVFVTVLRRILNARRPYELYAITPLLPAKRNGQSCPSRHTASAAVLTLAAWYCHPIAGIGFAVAAVVVTVSRVAAGVHFVRDVVVAWALVLLLGIPCFWLL